MDAFAACPPLSPPRVLWTLPPEAPSKDAEAGYVTAAARTPETHTNGVQQGRDAGGGWKRGRRLPGQVPSHGLGGWQSNPAPQMEKL